MKRAEQHFDELKREIAAYVRDQHYEVVPIDPSPECQEHGGACWDYQLRFTGQPDPRLAVIAGDVLFNLRSALDHIAVAMVPSQRRTKASFPIEVEPIWKREHGRFVVRDSERRRHWRDATKGMPESAIALIERLQPYHGIGAGAEQEALYQLNRLNNADKHRQLVLFAAGLLNCICDVHYAGGFRRTTLKDSEQGLGFAADGAHILHFSASPARPQKSDVNVQISGTPVVVFKVVRPSRESKRTGVMDIEALLAKLIEHVPAILTVLEPSVRRRS